MITTRYQLGTVRREHPVPSQSGTVTMFLRALIKAWRRDWRRLWADEPVRSWWEIKP